MQSGLSSIQSGFTILSALEESDLEWIFDTGQEQRVAAGEIVVTEGVRGEFIYFVLDGLFAVSSAAIGGREIARLGPGQIFGEMSFLEDRPTSATISALEDSGVLAVARPDLEAKLAADSGLAARTYKALAVIAAGRLRQLVGTLALWMEIGDQLPVSAPVMERWQKIADRTQQFKKAIVRADKDEAQAEDDAALAATLQEFSQFMNGAIGETSPETEDGREELGARIQREILPYFLKAQSTERLYKKPRGYACDYLALDMILKNEPAGTGRVGPLLDRAFLKLPVIRAVRGRKASIAAEITRHARASSGAIHITGIGCGAADPLFDAFKASPGKGPIHGTIIDFDSRGLAVAAAKRETLGLTDRLHLLNTSIVHLVSSHHELEVQDQDLIYGPTLADFLDDRLLLRLLNQAHRKLRPGGEFILSSFHPNNPDRAFLDHVIEWKVAHRNEDELRALFQKSDFQQSPVSFRYEPEKIILVAVCCKHV